MFLLRFMEAIAIHLMEYHVFKITEIIVMRQIMLIVLQLMELTQLKLAISIPMMERVFIKI